VILVIDNYDSFTYNLVQYLGILTGEKSGNGAIKVFRNDRLSLEQIRQLQPERIVISPGPGLPERAGRTVEIIREFGCKIPVLGICLGHQAIAVAYGGTVVEAPEIVHGKTSLIRHQNSPLFKGVPETFTATRYHSLVADRATLPAGLRITAETENGLIMSLEHRQDPVFGIQFHPESYVSEFGMTMMKNFLEV
jgi:anthranilate synthase/aminodeoxychorismate synthase-like glutamine amidotransferase